jgi:hypothetical protein
VKYGLTHDLALILPKSFVIALPLYGTLGSVRAEKYVLPQKQFDAGQVFRVTYCAARLQTTDNGAAISPYTVMKEMGHASLDMIERVYGRLGTSRHRAPVVEFATAVQDSGGEVREEQVQKVGR